MHVRGNAELTMRFCVVLASLTSLAFCAVEHVPVTDLRDAANTPERYKLRGAVGSQIKVNVALTGRARQSSTAGSTETLASASFANDGATHGYYDAPLQVTSVAQTKQEKDPWWEVELADEQPLWSLQIHFPREHCEGFWQQLKMENCGKFTRLVLSDAEPLVVELIGNQGTIVREQRRFTRYAPVITATFDGVTQAQRVRIRLPGPSRELALAEVILEGRASTCKGGHCIHGQCVGGHTCVCKPDYFGSDCSQHIQAAWRYLPFDLAPARNWWNPALAKRFDREIRASQYPTQCDKSTAIWQNVRYQGGFGSNIFELSGLLTRAFEGKPRKAFVPGRMNFMEHSNAFCSPETRLDKCLFKPWTQCIRVDEIEGPEIQRGHDDEGFMAAVPPYNIMGIFWYRAMFVRFMTELSDRTKQAIGLERLKRKIGYRHPIMGLHVRHTDSCHTTKRAGRCKPFSAYLREVGLMRKLYDIKRVFIATDDPDIIKEVKAYRGELQFVYVSGADREQLKRGSTEDIEKRLLKKDLKIDAGKMVLDALTDMTLLSHADVYIGHLQSNLSRLSFMLSTLQKRGFPPFISMDGSWCPHWRMCCDVHPITGKSTLC